MNFLSDVKSLPDFLGFTATFLIFGFFLLFLFGLPVDFSKREGALQYLVYAYIIGLLLYSLSSSIFKIWRNIVKKIEDKIKDKNLSTGKNSKSDVDVFEYLQKNQLVNQYYRLMIMFSANLRLFFGILIPLILDEIFPSLFPFHAPSFLNLWLLIPLAIFLFGYNLSYDKAVNEFVGEINAKI